MRVFAYCVRTAGAPGPSRALPVALLPSFRDDGALLLIEQSCSIVRHAGTMHTRTSSAREHRGGARRLPAAAMASILDVHRHLGAASGRRGRWRGSAPHDKLQACHTGERVSFKGGEWKGGAGDDAGRRGGVIGHRAEATHLFRRMGIALVKMLSSKCSRAAPFDAGGTWTARGRCRRSCGPTQSHSHATGGCDCMGPARRLDRCRPNRVPPTMTPGESSRRQTKKCSYPPI